MIYQRVSRTDPIRQGDLFVGLPLLGEDFNPAQVSYALSEGNKVEQGKWSDTPRSNKVLTSVRVVQGIVVTQDCDAARAPFISFFEVKPFLEVFRQQPPKQSEQPKWWVDSVTTRTQASAKLFYLPPDSELKIPERMAADFNQIFSLPASAIEGLAQDHRLGSLNAEAGEHFRESVARYFQRYPYDEWYVLTRDEVDTYETYRTQGQPVERRPYQKRSK